MEKENNVSGAESSDFQVVKSGGASLDLAPVPEGDFLGMIKRAEDFVKFQEKIRTMAIAITSSADWIDEGGHPYIQWGGTAKVARCLGVTVRDIRAETESLEDKNGRYLVCSYSGIGSWLGKEIQEIGVCSTRDDFFALRKGDDGSKIYLPLEEVDITDVKKKAHTNLLNRLIKSLVGLSYTWDEIGKISGGRITREICSGFSFGKGTKGGKAETAQAGDKRSLVWKLILELSDVQGDEMLATKKLQELTKYKDSAGKTDVSKVSEAQADFIIKTLQAQKAGQK